MRIIHYFFQVVSEFVTIVILFDVNIIEIFLKLISTYKLI